MVGVAEISGFEEGSRTADVVVNDDDVDLFDMELGVHVQRLRPQLLRQQPLLGGDRREICKRQSEALQLHLVTSNPVDPGSWPAASLFRFFRFH